MDSLDHKIPAGANMILIRNGAVVGATAIKGATSANKVGANSAHCSPHGIVDMGEYYHGERR